MVIPSRRDLCLSAAFGGGGAGLSLLELCMVLKRPTPWLLFKIKLIQNDRLAVEIEISPAVGLKRKCNFLGCEASRATTRRNLEELRMKTVGPKGKGRVDHLKTVLREKECSLSAHSFSLLMPSRTPSVPNNLIRLDVRRIARGVAFEVRFRAHSGRIPPPRSPASPQRR